MGDVAVPQFDTPRKANFLKEFLLPVAIVATILGGIELTLRFFAVPPYVLPTPSAIAKALYDNRVLLWTHALITLYEAVIGFIVGNVIGVGLAIVFVYSRVLERALFPVAQAVRSIPIVALAPLFLLWFGNGLAPKVITASLICFFPTLINTFKGLTSVDRSALELMHTLAATKSQTFWCLRWPAALPYVFAALKIATAASVIGALVAEWVGSEKGLGFLVVSSTYEFKIELLWATITVTALLSIILFEIVSLVERYAIPWQSETPLRD